MCQVYNRESYRVVSLQNLKDAIFMLGTDATESCYEEFEAEITIAGSLILVSGEASISYHSYTETRPDWGEQTIVEMNVENVEITRVADEHDTLRSITERAIIKLIERTLEL